jgi:hypothetical protein
MSELQRTIETMPEDQLLESAGIFLSEHLDIDDPTEASSRILALLGRPKEDAGPLVSAAEAVARQDTDELSAVLRLALIDAAASEDSAGQVGTIVEGAGQRQCIVTPDLVILCTLLLTGYIAVRNGGVAEETIEVTEEPGPDGKVKVTTRRTTRYLNPFAPLGQLLKNWLPPPPS